MNKMKKLFAIIISILLFVSCGAELPADNDNDVFRKHEEAAAAAVRSEKETEITTASPQENSEASPQPELYECDTCWSRGNIFDTNGVLLMYPSKDEQTYVTRLMNAEYSLCLSNILDDYSDGLDKRFESILIQPNKVPVNDKDTIGRSIQLTIDAEIQKKIYDILDEEGIIGSVVVMGTDGGLIAEVSCPSYDRNRLYTEEDYISTLGHFALGNRCLATASPGSCFKIMSEVICDKNDIRSQTDDGCWKFDDTSIRNWDFNDYPDRYPVERSLEQAFRNSSNVYFAKAFDTLGKDTVEKDLRDLFLFADDTKIDSDFGTLANSLNICSSDNLKRSAFGQANVRTSPMYLAALVREAVYGEMVRPYVLKNIVNTNDVTDIMEVGSPRGEVIASIPQEYREGIHNCMKLAGDDLISSGAVIPEGYTLYAKTGTAEVGSSYFMYLSTCIESEKNAYIIILQVQNTEDFDWSFASDMIPVYNKLSEVITEG